MADTTDRPDSITFNLESMAGLHVAVAMTRSLPLMSDLALQDRVLICTVVSELGTNILKFAGKGTVSLARVVDSGHDAIQVVAQDNGPGIRDLELAMQDGYSTAETLGLGLPAVRRIMSTMNVETGVGRGTKVVASKWLDNFSVSDRQRASGRWPRTEQRPLMDIEYAQRVRPYPGESVSGDVAVLRALDSGLLFGIIDGSGHGSEAHSRGATAQPGHRGGAIVQSPIVQSGSPPAGASQTCGGNARRSGRTGLSRLREPPAYLRRNRQCSHPCARRAFLARCVTRWHRR